MKTGVFIIAMGIMLYGLYLCITGDLENGTGWAILGGFINVMNNR